MPGWPTLVEQIKLADATPVIVRTHAEDGFSLHAETILSAITPRTRGIIINSPGNPTGALISEEELTAIARGSGAARHLGPARPLLREADLRPRRRTTSPACWPRTLRDRAVLCGSASKAYAMTGWRCGWAVGPAAVIARLQRAPEPRDVERLLDHAEGGRSGAARPAGLRHRDARRVPPPPRSAVRVAVGRPAHPPASSRPARSTCSPTYRSSCRPTASGRRPSSRRRCSTTRASR